MRKKTSNKEEQKTILKMLEEQQLKEQNSV